MTTTAPIQEALLQARACMMELMRAHTDGEESLCEGDFCLFHLTQQEASVVFGMVQQMFQAERQFAGGRVTVDVTRPDDDIDAGEYGQDGGELATVTFFPPGSDEAEWAKHLAYMPGTDNGPNGYWIWFPL